jgi:hypothetical protein
LRDAQWDAEYRERGFVVVPFVEPAELVELRGLVEDLIPSDAGPFFSLYRNDRTVRRRLDEVVRGALAARAEALFCDHRVFLGSVLVKFPGEGSDLALHQDWSFVDESRYMNGLVWLALEPTGEHNGGLHAVPGSHRLDLPFRGTPPGAQASEPVDTSAGEAVIYHDAVIHGSGRNASDHPRIALVLGFVSREAELLHYFVDGQSQKWRYRVRDEFFLGYDPPERPGGPHVIDVEPCDPTHHLLDLGDLDSLPRQQPGPDVALPSTRPGPMRRTASALARAMRPTNR